MSREFTGGWLDGAVPVLTGERKEMSPPIPPKHEASVTPNPSAPVISSAADKCRHRDHTTSQG